MSEAFSTMPTIVLIVGKQTDSVLLHVLSQLENRFNNAIVVAPNLKPLVREANIEDIDHLLDLWYMEQTCKYYCAAYDQTDQAVNQNLESFYYNHRQYGVSFIQCYRDFTSFTFSPVAKTHIEYIIFTQQLDKDDFKKIWQNYLRHFPNPAFYKIYFQHLLQSLEDACLVLDAFNQKFFLLRPTPVTTPFQLCHKMKSITFVTGNSNKLKEVQAMLTSVMVHSMDLDLPEIQGEPHEIARYKCKLAVQEVEGPVLVEDTSLCFNALNGLPGPYVKWFYSKLGLTGLQDLLHAYKDKTARALCVFAYCPGPREDIITFQGSVDGSIVPARGDTRFGWDPIFQPHSSDKTFAEMTEAEKNRVSHRQRALEKVNQFFTQE